MTKILCNYNDATVKCLDMFTSGMVGAEISFEFSEEWEGLTKTAVFSAGDVQRDVLIGASNVITIPWEVLQRAKEQLIVGVYGTNGTELVIPTVYAGLGRIKTGADPSGDPGIPPTPSILDQAIQAAAESIAGAQSAAASEAAAEQILEEVKDVQTGVQAQIDAINDLIPEDADPENKLATESFVNDAAGEIIDKLGAVPVVVSSSIEADETAATLVETTVNLNTGADAEHLVPMPIANTEQVGMMTPEQVAALQNALTAISALQGQTVRLLYVAGNTPTAAEIQAFVISHGYDDPTKWPGFAVVVAGTYHIWHYYNDDGWRDDGLDTVSVATSSILGVVKGSNTDGKIFVESDGTMTMNGYDAIITALANLAANKADDDLVYHEFKLNYNGTNITKDGQQISFADVLTACNDRTKFVYLVADNRLFIPQYTDAGIVSFSCAYVNDDDLNIRRIRYLANGNITSAVVSTYTKAQIDAMISELKETINGKQDELVAGENITIEGNVISATGGVMPTITVTAPTGSSVVATKGSKTLTATEEAGTWTFKIPEFGVWNITATRGAESAADTVNVTTVSAYTVELSYIHTYGVEWDGTSSTKLSRTDDAFGFADPVPYVAGASNYGSPFDDCMPWAGMQKSTDSAAGVLVSIPKFWYKLTPNGSRLKIQIADAPLDGFHVAPAHIDRGDGKGERDVVYIGRYHCHSSNYKSQTGGTPKNNITRSTARSSIHNLGSDIWQSDFAMRFTLWLLYIVEFADWNSQKCIGYGCGNNSGVQNMGYTDSMPYHTGTTQSSRTTYGLGTQYRWIEGLWDNVYDWCDGCYNDGNGLNIILKPSNFSDSSNGIAVGTPTNGWTSAWSVKNVNGTFPLMISAGTAGSETTYITDNWDFNSSRSCLRVGGVYNQYGYLGMFHVYYSSASYADVYVGARLQKLP